MQPSHGFPRRRRLRVVAHRVHERAVRHHQRLVPARRHSAERLIDADNPILRATILAVVLHQERGRTDREHNTVSDFRGRGGKRLTGHWGKPVRVVGVIHQKRLLSDRRPRHTRRRGRLLRHERCPVGRPRPHIARTRPLERVPRRSDRHRSTEKANPQTDTPQRVRHQIRQAMLAAFLDRHTQVVPVDDRGGWALQRDDRRMPASTVRALVYVLAVLDAVLADLEVPAGRSEHAVRLLEHLHALDQTARVALRQRAQIEVRLRAVKAVEHDVHAVPALRGMRVQRVTDMRGRRRHDLVAVPDWAGDGHPVEEPAEQPPLPCRFDNVLDDDVLELVHLGGPDHVQERRPAPDELFLGHRTERHQFLLLGPDRALAGTFAHAVAASR